jgi:hypothetical protein
VLLAFDGKLFAWPCPNQLPVLADAVAKVFCRLWRATLIRNDEQQRSFDSLQSGF